VLDRAHAGRLEGLGRLAPINVRLDTGNAKGRIAVTLQLANGDKCTTGIAPITYSVSIRR
jgi:hypothetical protein